jgi:hypothetical protein
MNAGESKQYKFGQKNNWRRWVWNRIVDRLQVPPNQAVGLYLAGADDLDWQEARRRGFKRDNMIAIDRSPAVVDQLRGSGCLAVKADFLSALRSVSGDRRVDFVYGDFCCDLEDPMVKSIYDLFIMARHLKGAVYAFNFQRGRGTRIRWVKTLGKVFPDGEEKHRGAILAMAIFTQLLGYAHARFDLFDAQDVKEYLESLPGFVTREVMTRINPAFATYASGKLRFDSVVFSSGRTPFDSHDAELHRLAGVLKDEINLILSPDVSVRRRLAAAFAHRTMRLEGTGPYVEAR